MNAVRAQLEALRQRVAAAMHADRKQWLMRGLGALLIGALLMLAALILGAGIAIWQLLL